MFEDVLRFWLDRGVDGFRVDVAHGAVQGGGPARPGVAEGEPPSSDTSRRRARMVERTLRDEPMWDQPEVHDVYRRWQQVLAEYDGDRMAVAEAWTPDARVAWRSSCGPTSSSQTFNFPWLLADWSAASFARGHQQHARARWPRCGARADLGAAATTTWSGTPPATAAAPLAWPAPGRPRWRCWRCPARRTSTRARSSASSRSTSPASTVRTRRVPHRRATAATAAGCRSRGRGDAPPYGVRPGRRASPGCRSPTTGPRSRSRRSGPTRARRWRSTGPPWRRAPHARGRPGRRRRVARPRRRRAGVPARPGHGRRSTAATTRSSSPAARSLVASGPVDGEPARRTRRVWLR